MSTRYLYSLLLACVVGVFLTACDQSSQNIEYEVAENLTVSGPSSVEVPSDTTVTAEYIVKAFTIEKDYSWSVDGVANIRETKRQGEVVVVELSQTGEYTVTVETTVGGEPASGSVSAVAESP